MIPDVGLIRSGCAAFEGSQGLGSKPRVDGIRHSVKFSGVKRRARENADHAGEDILVSGAAMLGLYGRPEEASQRGPWKREVGAKNLVGRVRELVLHQRAQLGQGKFHMTPSIALGTLQGLWNQPNFKFIALWCRSANGGGL